MKRLNATHCVVSGPWPRTPHKLDPQEYTDELLRSKEANQGGDATQADSLMESSQVQDQRKGESIPNITSSQLEESTPQYSLDTAPTVLVSADDDVFHDVVQSSDAGEKDASNVEAENQFLKDEIARLKALLAQTSLPPPPNHP